MAKPSGGKLYVVLRTVGELLITVGIVVLLFVVYTLYVTDLVAARKQREAEAELEKSWQLPPAERIKPVRGKPFARLHITRPGDDLRFAITEGVGKAELDVGPGHYPTSALPGEPGNFAVAGHRIGKGAPFNDLDQLAACDAVIVETAQNYFVYRVMPMADQVPNWDRNKRRDPRCAKVPSPQDGQNGEYRQTVGRRIVTPDRGDAVAPVPYRPDAALPIAQQASLLTLTTCHPEFGNSHRMIIHAVLVQQIAKKAVADHRTLLEQIGEN